uniref:putative receptor-like protein kinase At5g39000 n=1 Tax=Erigeron canadensis TaxID=72917 RepID=UPI001CB9A3B1|nr:putative receptor-like protein kinase At5g39000 [Erigeron canadensis]
MSSSSVKPFAQLQFPLAEIVVATNNFADENFIERHAFGNAYKGRLLVGGELVTITARRLDRTFGQREVQFWKEVTLLSSLKHENIVSNIGYCEEEGEYIVINKHDLHGSLAERVRDKTNITWTQRLKISVGIACALSYIHYDEKHDFSIIHMDIKSGIIFLDENWVPKLSSFERSVNVSVAERHRAHSSGQRRWGTPGYVDPLGLKTGMVSHTSDVYSLGVVLFEILCGRVASDPTGLEPFRTKAKSHYENRKLNDLIDPDLRAQMDQQSFDYFSEIAYHCLNEDPLQRPNAHGIVRILNKALELQQEHEKPPLISKVPSIAVVEVEDPSYRSLEVIDLHVLSLLYMS